MKFSTTERFPVTATCVLGAGITFESRLTSGFKCCSTTGGTRSCFGRVRSADPLGFVDSKPYAERLKVYNKKFPATDAVLVGLGEIAKIPTVVAAMEYGFMGGSMGSAVGEKIARAITSAVSIASCRWSSFPVRAAPECRRGFCR